MVHATKERHVLLWEPIILIQGTKYVMLEPDLKERKHWLGRAGVPGKGLLQAERAARTKALQQEEAWHPAGWVEGTWSPRSWRFRTRFYRWDDPVSSTYFNSQKCPHLDNYMIMLHIAPLIILTFFLKAEKNFMHSNNMMVLGSQNTETASLPLHDSPWLHILY